MKTIAISIDEATLSTLDRLTGKDSRRGAGAGKRSSRSELVRRALHDFLERQGRAGREARERSAIARHKDMLARQAAALVKQQAEP